MNPMEERRAVPWTALLAVAILAAAPRPARAQGMEKKDAPAKQDKRIPDPLKHAEEAEGEERGGVSGLWGRILEEVEVKGYIEAHYNHPEFGSLSRRDPARADLHRLVLGLEYAFTDQVKFEIEVEFEHGGEEIEVEEAFLEYQWVPELAFQAGGLLLPVGMINGDHLPTRFYSVERPYLDHLLVPSTWMEPGIGAFGQLPDDGLFAWVSVVGGLEAEGFTALEGIRGGRGAGRDSKADDLAVVARAVWSPIQDPRLAFDGMAAPADPALVFGGSVYWGEADQAVVALDGVDVLLAEGDVRLQAFGFDLRAQVVQIRVDEAGRASAFTGETIGEVMQGWYAEAAFHLFWLLLPEDVQDLADDLVVFGRFEDLDTNKRVGRGMSRRDDADREVWIVGAAYSPVPKVVFKADFEFWRDELDDTVTRFNLGFGLVF